MTPSTMAGMGGKYSAFQRRWKLSISGFMEYGIPRTINFRSFRLRRMTMHLQILTQRSSFSAQFYQNQLRLRRSVMGCRCKQGLAVSSIAFGTSHFTRQGDMWVQEYSGGGLGRFALSGRIVLNGCIGSFLYGINNFDVEIFVPDKGCGTMECLARIKKGTWDVLGSMENIR
jgi:hypothetical protein